MLPRDRDGAVPSQGCLNLKVLSYLLLLHHGFRLPENETMSQLKGIELPLATAPCRAPDGGSSDGLNLKVLSYLLQCRASADDLTDPIRMSTLGSQFQSIELLLVV